MSHQGLEQTVEAVIETGQEDDTLAPADQPPRRYAGRENVTEKTESHLEQESTEIDSGSRTRPQRLRMQTTKGLAYQVEMKRKRREQLYKQLAKKMDHIKSSMIEDVSENDMNNMYSHWLSLYENCMYVHEELGLMMSEDDKNHDIIDWFQPRAALIDKFKRAVENWFLHSDEETTDAKYTKSTEVNWENSHKVAQSLLKADDVNSVVSKRSHHSSSSAASVASSVAMAKIKEDQKRAALQIKAARLKQKENIQQASLQLQIEKEKLEIEEEIAISAAKSQVLEEYEQRSSPQVRSPLQGPKMDRYVPNMLPLTRTFDEIEPIRNPGMNDDIAAVTKARSVKQTAGKQERRQNQSESGRAPELIADSRRQLNSSYPDVALLSMVRQLNKPITDMKKFGGSPLEYRKFMRQFKAKIVNNTLDDDERLHYLEQYTEGEPNKIVSALSYLSGEVAYTAALTQLEERYGKPDIIVNAYIKKALSWPAMKLTNVKTLDEYSIFLTECMYAVQDQQAMHVLEYVDNFRKLVAKLPLPLHDKWRNLVRNTKDRGGMVTFPLLVDFVRREATKLKDPTFGREAMSSDLENDKSGKTTPKKIKNSFSTSVNESQQTTQRPKASAWKPPCTFCDDSNHALSDCNDFFKKPPKEKFQFIKTKGFCFSCLKSGHSKAQCWSKSKCSHCQGRHPSVMHYEGKLQQVATEDNSTHDATNSIKKPQLGADSNNQLVSHMGAGGVDCTMAIVPVRVRMNNGLKELETYAFLDPGSNVSFCTERLLRKIGGMGTRLRITVNTMGMSQKMNTMKVRGLQISDIQSQSTIDMPEVYTKDIIPVTKSHIPTESDISRWPHLQDVALPQIEAGIDLLIGNNVPDAYTPVETKVGPRGSPHATRTLLGWIAWNVMRNNTEADLMVNRAEVLAIQEAEERSSLNKLYERSMKFDFPEHVIDDKRENSVEDEIFMKCMEKSVEFKDGHYQLDLPFRDESFNFPDNKIQAVQQLHQLERKFLKNTAFYNDYRKFMTDIIDKGYAEKVPEHLLDRSDGKVWFLPHHGVYHPKSRTKSV
jgi:hypothetical protein